MIDLTPADFRSTLFVGISTKPDHVSLPSTKITPSPLLAETQQTFPVPFTSLTVGEQIHGTRIEQIFPTSLTPLTILPGTDGLMTRASGTALGIFTADCTAAMIYNSSNACLGLVHAGWRGTYEGILETLVGLMNTAYDAKPSDSHALLGPAIGSSCYEISEDLAEKFRTRFSFSKPFFSPTSSGKPRLDLRGLQRAQLIRTGIPENHIAISTDCTHCHPDRYYSYRRDGTLAGRHLTLAVLLNN